MRSIVHILAFCELYLIPKICITFFRVSDCYQYKMKVEAIMLLNIEVKSSFIVKIAISSVLCYTLLKKILLLQDIQFVPGGILTLCLDYRGYHARH